MCRGWREHRDSEGALEGDVPGMLSPARLGGCGHIKGSGCRWRGSVLPAAYGVLELTAHNIYIYINI